MAVGKAIAAKELTPQGAGGVGALGEPPPTQHGHDVLDELETIQICVGYQIDGKPISGLPVVVDRFAQCKPIYEEWAGWQASTVGITEFDELPEKARAYLARIEELAGVPVDIISTGPDRKQTIIKSDPFE